MLPIGRNALVLSAFLAALVLLGWSRRLRPAWAVALAVGAVMAGVTWQVLVPGDVLTLADDCGLQTEVLLLLLWALFGAFAAGAGGLRLPGPPLLVAMAAGALLGEIGAAAVLGAAATDRRAAARLALAGAAGGLLGRIGDPALLVMGERVPELPLLLAPLALFLAAVARPRSGDLKAGGGSMPATVIAASTAVAACVPGWTLAALAVGSVALAGLGWRGWKLAGGQLAWVAGGVVLVLAATASGAADLAAVGLETIAEYLLGAGSAALALAGALLAALLDGPAAALFGTAVLDRALSLSPTGLLPDAGNLDIDGAWRGLAVGVSVGGLGPLVVARAVRPGLRLWLVSVVVAAAWAWFIG